MFQQASYVVFTKTDLLPHVPFDIVKARASALEVNPDLKFFTTSALTGEGLEEWYDFLRSQVTRPVEAEAK
jgi:hydrogenase nickel incorporation protein HypB